MATAAAPELDRGRLTSVAAGALGRSIDALGDWAVTPLGYTVFNPVSQGIFRVRGTALSGGNSLPWSAVLKICRAPSDEELTEATADRRAVLLETLRWDREGDAYASGLLETLLHGLAAPRCLCVDRHDGTLWIWLEDVADDAAAWDVARYALAARHLGRLGGEYLAGRPLPQHQWLSRGWIRTWSTYFSRTMPAILEADGLWAQPPVVELFDRDARDELRRLWSMRERWWNALDRLPSTLSHLDAFRGNLMSRTARGRVETVAIDWAFVGIAPIAADVATLSSPPVLSGDHLIRTESRQRAWATGRVRESATASRLPSSSGPLRSTQSPGGRSRSHRCARPVTSRARRGWRRCCDDLTETSCGLSPNGRDTCARSRAASSWTRVSVVATAMQETTDLLQQLIKNECVNDGTVSSGHEIRSADTLASYLQAPGVEIKTTWPGGGYRQLTGNSFACPYVVGIIALLIEAYPNLTPFQVKTILYTIAKRNQEKAALSAQSAEPNKQ